MNHTLRLLLCCAAACALAAGAARKAEGRQGRRGGGNPAEIERLERERRDREMRERDMRERQFLLRTMEADRRPAERPQPRLAVAQIRADFVRLQVVNNELARAVAGAAKGGPALDLKLVAKSAGEIRKLAERLKENLALPEQEAGGGAKGAAGGAPAQLGPALSALDRLILKFADDLAARGVQQVDASSSADARRALEEIIALSGWVKKASEKQGRDARQ